MEAMVDVVVVEEEQLSLESSCTLPLMKRSVEHVERRRESVC